MKFSVVSVAARSTLYLLQSHLVGIDTLTAGLLSLTERFLLGFDKLASAARTGDSRTMISC